MLWNANRNCNGHEEQIGTAPYSYLWTSIPSTLSTVPNVGNWKLTLVILQMQMVVLFLRLLQLLNLLLLP